MKNTVILLNEKIQELKEENSKLRKELEIYQKNKSSSTTLTKDEKISIYREYFFGRQDVVSQRYYNTKKGKYGYAPLCKNNFNKMFCAKLKGKKINCIKCPNREFIPMSNDLLLQHFRDDKKGNNKVCLGIYPLMSDGTCQLLAIDFDNYNWLEEMECVYRIARGFNLTSLLERSQSGNGGHLWLFFTTPIKAVKVRKLGKFLLKEAMRMNQNITLQSFDRMFPNQDYISQEGLGNLIALPLQSTAYQNGNSAFITEKGEIITNPIGYLSTISKITEMQLDKILQLNEDGDYFFDNNQLTIPTYAETKYDSQLELIKRNMLYIKKKNLNSLSINMIRRVASMYNPEYFLLQRLHKPIYKTPYILYEYMEDENYIALPKGCLEKIRKVFIGSNITLKDESSVGHPIDIEFIGNLKEQQTIAIKEMLRHEQGVLQATAGFGKTVMSLKIIGEIKCSTLIIVNTKKLLDQWLKQIHNFLNIPKAEKKRDSYVGQFTGSKKNLKYNLDVATASALSNHEDLESLLKPYGMVIIDECHHIPSNSFRVIMSQIYAKYIFGLSATPNRQDGLEKLIYMYCGPKRFETNKKLIISQRKFQQILIPHFMNTKSLGSGLTYQELVEEIAENDNRNFYISKDVIESFGMGRKIIVLSERISHLNILYEKIRDVSPNVFLYLGNLKQKDKKNLEDSILNLKENENYIILATSKLLGEGFDLPSLDTLFLTLPISDKNRIEQYTGRLHREFNGKSDVKVHDYVDIHIPVFDSMFQKRLKAYYQEGYQLQEEEKMQDLTTLVYYKDNFLEAYKQDISFSKKQVVIRMNTYHLSKVKKYHNLLIQISQKGIKIIIVFEDSINEESALYFKGAGCELRMSNCHIRSNFIVIDKTIVWYGDMNIFTNISLYASLIRLENKTLAQELLDGI